MLLNNNTVRAQLEYLLSVDVKKGSITGHSRKSCRRQRQYMTKMEGMRMR